MAGSAIGGQITAPLKDPRSTIMSGSGAPMMGGKGGGQAIAPSRAFNVNQAAAGALESAMQGTAAGMGYQPQAVRPTGYGAFTIGQSPTVSAQSVRAGQLAGSDLSAYTNPYESQVIDQSLADIERSRLMQQNQLGAQASRAGAFGGSRQAIAEAETNRAFAEQAARTASSLRQAGFTQAQQMAQQDIGTAQQAALANQQANLQAGTTTAGFGQQSNLANQAVSNAASQFGAQQGMAAQLANQAASMQANQGRLGAAAQMGLLGQQAFNTSGAIQDRQQREGLMQQGLQQSIIDAARNQFRGYANAPNVALAAPLAAIGVTPYPQSSSTSRSPGLFDYLGLGAGLYAASDRRLKENIRPAGKMNGIKFYTWDWNEKGKKVAAYDQPNAGVIADEIQETHPHLVKRGADGYLRVNYAGLASEMAGV
jgi:hypothetical protein